MLAQATSPNPTGFLYIIFNIMGRPQSPKGEEDRRAGFEAWPRTRKKGRQAHDHKDQHA